MPIYTCKKCNKEFDRKCNYNYHINRKFSCIKNDKLIQCDKCLKIFKHKSTLYNHKKTCKNIIKDTCTKNKSEINKNKKIIDNEINYNKNEQIHITNNYNNKFIINNTINNIIINNVYISPYNIKDKIQLKNETYLKILDSGFKSIPKLIEESHFNKEYPQHHNIYIPNIKVKYILVYTGKEWEIRNSDEVLNELINYKIYELEEKFDEIMNSLDKSVIKKFQNFLDKKEEDYTKNLIKKDLKILLYNKRFIPIETSKQLNDKECITKIENDNIIDRLKKYNKNELDYIFNLIKM